MKKLLIPLLLASVLGACTDDINDVIYSGDIVGAYDATKDGDIAYIVIDKKLDYIRYDYKNDTATTQKRKDCYDKYVIANLKDRGDDNYAWTSYATGKVDLVKLFSKHSSLTITNVTDDKKTETRKTYTRSSKKPTDFTPLCK